MMASVYVGDLFSSFFELKKKIDEYQRQRGVKLYIRNSRTLDAARRKTPNRYFNQALKYYELQLSCNGKSVLSESTEALKSVTNQQHCPQECQMLMKLSVTYDGQYLEVKKLYETHNHPLGLTNPNDRQKTFDKDYTVRVPTMSLKERYESQRLRPNHTNKRKINAENSNLNLDTLEKRSKPIADANSANSVDLGKQLERWQILKDRLNLSSDEQLAEFLLNGLESEVEIITPGEEGLRPSFLSTSQLNVSHCEHEITDNDCENLNPVTESSTQHEIGACLPSREEIQDQSLALGSKEMESAAVLHAYQDTEQNSASVPNSSPNCVSLETLSNTEVNRNGTEESLKNGRTDNQNPTVVDLGKQHQRWTSLKEKLNILTDEDLAKFLIDHQWAVDQQHSVVLT